MKLFIVVFLVLASRNYAGAQSELYDDSSMSQESHSRYPRWHSLSYLMPGAEPYKMKIIRRIQNSHVLRNMPLIQKKLYKLADEKLENCVTPFRLDMDKHCVGRNLGQIMQFISAVENSSSDKAYAGEMEREEKDNQTI